MSTLIFYLAVNKLKTDKWQNIFLIAEHSSFIKYILTKLNLIIWINSILFYLAVNKLIIDKMQSIFSLKAEHSGFMKYTLNKLD